jgi:hypothetical protein
MIVLGHRGHRLVGVDRAQVSELSHAFLPEAAPTAWRIPT